MEILHGVMGMGREICAVLMGAACFTGGTVGARLTYTWRGRLCLLSALLFSVSACELALRAFGGLAGRMLVLLGGGAFAALFGAMGYCAYCWTAECMAACKAH